LGDTWWDKIESKLINLLIPIIGDTLNTPLAIALERVRRDNT